MVKHACTYIFLVTQLHEFYLHVIGKTYMYMYTVSVYVYALSFLATFFNPSEFLRISKFEGNYLTVNALRLSFLIKL